MDAETHSWQQVLVRGIWKPSPFCHPAKFKIDLPVKFLDAFTEYNIQAEVSRRPACFLWFLVFLLRLRWLNGVPYCTRERVPTAKPVSEQKTKTSHPMGNLFSCWASAWEITSLPVLDCLSKHLALLTIIPPEVVIILLLWLWQVLNRPPGPGGGLWHSTFEKHKPHVHQFRVCLPSPSDAFLKGCTFLKQRWLMGLSKNF